MKFCAAAAATTAILLLSACGGSGGGDQVVNFADASEFDFGPVQSAVDPTDDTDFAAIFNNLRASRGLGDVTYDARLDAAAEKYAIEQAGLPGLTLSHTGQNGSTVYDRIVAEGYDPIGWAENLAKGQQNQAQVLQDWIDSPGHDANLSAPLENFALGVAGSGSSLSWVLLMATERPD